MDFYGCSFVVLILAIIELVTIGWIYGVPRLCKDIKFMLGWEPSVYWKYCWRYLVTEFFLFKLLIDLNFKFFKQTPGIMMFIFFYDLLHFKTVTYDGYVYPTFVYNIGWCISIFGLIWLPIFAYFAIKKQDESTLMEVSHFEIDLSSFN